MKNPIVNGTLIALAAATSLFAAACGKSSDDASMAKMDKMAKVHCQGVNECKGKASCKSAANACAGQNGCKGQGHVDGMTTEECTAQGGTAMAAN